LHRIKPWVTLLCAVVICFFATFPVSAKDKERAWQDGILLDSNTQTGSRAVGTANGINTLRNDLTYYQIDAGNMIYVVARSLRSHHDKALYVTINGHVQFAIDGSTCYLRDEQGKEHTLTVEKKIAKAQ
jgi:hypothetical protein